MRGSITKFLPVSCATVLIMARMSAFLKFHFMRGCVAVVFFCIDEERLSSGQLQGLIYTVLIFVMVTPDLVVRQWHVLLWLE